MDNTEKLQSFISIMVPSEKRLINRKLCKGKIKNIINNLNIETVKVKLYFILFCMNS